MWSGHADRYRLARVGEGMLIKRGIAVSPGVVIGPALVFGSEDFRIPYRTVDPQCIDEELSRLERGLAEVAEEIRQSELSAAEQIGKQYAAIFAAHLHMIEDASLIASIQRLIREDCFSAEFASSRVLRGFARQFQEIKNPYFAERAVDIFDLEKRLLRHLLGERREDLANLTAPVLVLAHNLTPSETAGLDRRFVLGFATEIGGHTSHTAILAGALEIPAVVGLGSFLSDVSGGETVIIDGNRGQMIVDPDEETLASYRDSEARMRSVAARMESYSQVRAETQDGVRIQLMGNVEFPEEAELCQQRGADGIGLYRTEFLYLGQEVSPTEEDHYDAYRRVIGAVGQQPVIIRTLDVGADKIPGAKTGVYAPECNSVLGLRSIRLSLHDVELFRVQLRAILRAAKGANVSIMFPMVTTLLEFRQARLFVREVMEDLEEQGTPFNRDVAIGMMVEVPAAAVMADAFAREVDFFSIGTNDLIQYTMAADRSDPAVAKWFSSGDPAIIRLLKRVIDCANQAQKPVSVCGQMSSDPKYLPLLLGLGLRQLSVPPQAIPIIKQLLCSLTIRQAEEIAAQVLEMDTATSIEFFLRGELNKICPEANR